MKLPTRISIDQFDPGYIKNKDKRRSFEVLLDGVPLRGVITADSTTGEVYKNKIDPETGKYVTDGEWWARETLKGKVEIRLKNAAPSSS